MEEKKVNKQAVEVSEEELENVSGGAIRIAYLKLNELTACPYCGKQMKRIKLAEHYFVCPKRDIV